MMKSPKEKENGPKFTTDHNGKRIEIEGFNPDNLVKPVKVIESIPPSDTNKDFASRLKIISRLHSTAQLLTRPSKKPPSLM